MPERAEDLDRRLRPRDSFQRAGGSLARRADGVDPPLRRRLRRRADRRRRRPVVHARRLSRHAAGRHPARPVGSEEGQAAADAGDGAGAGLLRVDGGQEHRVGEAGDAAGPSGCSARATRWACSPSRTRTGGSARCTSATTRSKSSAALDTIVAGGETDMYPALDKAYLALRESSADLKHIIVLTDGVSSPGDFDGLVKQIAAAGITLSTVAIGAGGRRPALRDIAEQGQGALLLLRRRRPRAANLRPGNQHRRQVGRHRGAVLSAGRPRGRLLAGLDLEHAADAVGLRGNAAETGGPARPGRQERRSAAGLRAVTAAGPASPSRPTREPLGGGLAALAGVRPFWTRLAREAMRKCRRDAAQATAPACPEEFRIGAENVAFLKAIPGESAWRTIRLRPKCSCPPTGAYGRRCVDLAFLRWRLRPYYVIDLAVMNGQPLQSEVSRRPVGDRRRRRIKSCRNSCEANIPDVDADGNHGRLLAAAGLHGHSAGRVSRKPASLASAAPRRERSASRAIPPRRSPQAESISANSSHWAKPIACIGQPCRRQASMSNSRKQIGAGWPPPAPRRCGPRRGLLAGRNARPDSPTKAIDHRLGLAGQRAEPQQGLDHAGVELLGQQRQQLVADAVPREARCRGCWNRRDRAAPDRSDRPAVRRGESPTGAESAWPGPAAAPGHPRQAADARAAKDAVQDRFRLVVGGMGGDDVAGPQPGGRLLRGTRSGPAGPPLRGRRRRLGRVPAPMPSPRPTSHATPSRRHSSTTMRLVGLRFAGPQADG